ncbi:MAG: hypothetical protein HY882_05515 [Deltaproteobacteria bacterium]|nr:hypothetical protein [Deltaproteobacteria bacterium]
MKIRVLVVAIAMISLLGESACFAAEEAKVTGKAGLGVFSQYVSRGYEYSAHSIVFQPCLSIAYRGFSVSFWSNIDSYEHATQSFTPDRPGQKSFNETDLTLSYTYNLGKLELTGGYLYYATKYSPETEELYISVTYDTIAKPTLAIYRDITEFPGTYINLSFSQSWKVYREITLDLGGSVGYFAGDSDYWKTFESSTGGYTGEKYQAFHDGMVRVGFTVPILKNLAVQPVVQYWFPLSDKARRTVNGNSYNPAGKLDETFVTGVNLTYNF